MERGLFQSDRDFESRDKRAERNRLTEMLGKVAEEINEKLNTIEGLSKTPFLEDDCRINPSAFATKKKGPYRKTPDKAGEESEVRPKSIQEDNEKIKELEIQFSGADREAIQKHYGAVMLKEEDRIDHVLGKWRENQKDRKSELAEELIYLILHKKLGNDYIVMRSATYDDYMNGVDTLILDRETGDVVCAFDELLDFSVEQRMGQGDGSDEFSDRLQAKISRSKDHIKKGGGMRAKYALGYNSETKEFSRESKKNIPAFCLPITPEDFDDLMANINPDMTKDSRSEVHMVQKIIEAIEEQIEILNEGKVEENQKNIIAMGNLVNRLRESIE